MGATILLFTLVLVRVGAFVAVFPFLSGRNTPRLVRAALAFSLAMFWFVTLDPRAELPRVPPAELPWLFYALALGREALIGLAAGFLFSLFLAPVRIAGEFITGQIGLAQSVVLGAAADTAAGPITLILETLAGLIFFSLDGHHIVLSLLHASFARHPLGGSLVLISPPAAVETVIVAQTLGLQLAGPLVLVMFLLTVVLALMARIAPQINIYTVGFTLQAMTALIGLMFLLPDLLRTMAVIFTRIGQLSNQLL
jgi:flagellar biosynthetic protein FliR